MSSSDTYLDAQSAVLGSMLLSDVAAAQIVRELQPEDFGSSTFRKLYTAAREIVLGGEPLDPVTLLARAGKAYEPTVVSIMETTPTAANFKAYCEIVTQQAALGRIQAAAMEIINAADAEEARGLLAKASAAALSVGRVQSGALSEALGSLYIDLNDGKRPDYLSWGIRQLDKKLLALPGSFVFIAARPSAGKTALALQLALHIAKTKRVGFYSLETGSRQITQRIAASISGVALASIKSGTLAPLQMEQFSQAASVASSLSLDIVEAAGMSAPDIEAHALSKRHEVIFIDYVQIVDVASDRRSGTRQEEMASVSRSLHAFAQRSGTTVIALAQLSRQDSGGVIRAPQLSDLRESGQFEQDADAVVFIYLTDPQDYKSNRKIKIGKNKDGELGEFEMIFDGPHQRFLPPETRRREEPPRRGFYQVDDDTHLPEGWV